MTEDPVARAGEPGRRPVVFQEAVAPARVFGVWPVAVLAAVALVVALVATGFTGHLRHGTFWWLPGGAWVAVGIGIYGSWHVRRHRRIVLADEQARAALTPPG